MSFIRELKRRNVLRVAVVYLAVSWLILQVADVLFPVLQLPDWTMRFLVGLLTLGLPVAVTLAWAFNLTPEGIRREEDDPTTPTRSSEQKRRLDFIIIGVLLAVIGYLVYQQDPFGANDGAERSIAVLPFEDFSPNGDNEYFSDGIAEELLNTLVGVEGLRVAARTSSFAFKNQNEDVE